MTDAADETAEPIADTPDPMADEAPTRAVEATETADVAPVGIGLGIGKMVIVAPPLTSVEMAEAEPAIAEEVAETTEPGLGIETVTGFGMMMGVIGGGTRVEGSSVEKAEAGM